MVIYFRFKVRRRLTEAVKWWGEPIEIVTEIVPRFAFNLRHCPRTPAPSGQKKCPERTGLLLGTELHGAHFGERQSLPRDLAPPPPFLVRGFGGGGASRFNPARDPNHVSQETLIKQHPPGGLKAGSGACDAPQQTGRDHYHHDAGNWLAAPLGPRLFDNGGAQKARPDTCLR